MNCLRRSDLAYLRSVNTPDYPAVDYLPIAPGSPEQTLIDSVPRKYWKLTGDVLAEMDAGEKATADAAIATARRDANRAEAVAEPDADTGEAFELRALIELFNKRDNYLTNRIIELQDAMDAMKVSSGAAQNIRDAIPASWSATTTRTRGEAVQAYKDDINAGGVDS